MPKMYEKETQKEEEACRILSASTKSPVLFANFGMVVQTSDSVS